MLKNREAIVKTRHKKTPIHMLTQNIPKKFSK